MPYCLKCGYKVNPEARFCARCGTQRTPKNTPINPNNNYEGADIHRLKQILLQTYNVADEIDKIYPVGAKSGNKLREFHQKDVMCFLLYLSASDGKVTTREKDFLNTLFDFKFSEQDYVSLINSLDIYLGKDLQDIPLTIKACAYLDKHMKRIEPSATLSAPILIELYKAAGQAIIACDGHKDFREVQNLETYLRFLNNAVFNIMNSAEITPAPTITTAMTNSTSFSEPSQEPTTICKSENENLNEKNNSVPSTLKSYPSSIYKVGNDIPAGKYKVFSNSKGSSYYSICNDPNGDDIVVNDNFINQAYVDIHNGQYLELSDCYAVPLKEAPMYKENNYVDGEYLVGIEIAPGEYKVQANPGEDGYYSLETFANDGSRNIDSNRSFNNAAYVAPRQGQILILKGCTLSSI